MVDHYIPTSLKDALTALDKKPYKLMAGGTDLMVQHRATSETPPHFDMPLMFIFNIDDLKTVRKTKHGINIGAMTSLETLLNENLTPPLLKEVIGVMASPGIRNISTLAGNIGNASPAGDSLVALYALDAVLSIASINGTRYIPINDYIQGPRKTIKEANELITAITIPDDTFTHSQFKKVGGRKADAISKVAFVGLATVQDGMIKDIRISVNAVYKTVVRVKEAETLLTGVKLADVEGLLDAFMAYYDQAIQPIDDQRSNKKYRKTIALNLIKTFVKSLT